MDFSKILEWLKLSPKYLIPISLVSGFALFASSDILEIFGINSLVAQIRPYLGIIFLLSSALLITNVVMSVYFWIQNKYQEGNNLRMLQKRLHSLTDGEKRILEHYINNQTRSQYLSMLDGVVNGLELENIIFRSSNVARGVDRWAYNIQPWAWEYLNKHRNLLVLTNKDAPKGENEFYRRSPR